MKIRNFIKIMAFLRRFFLEYSLKRKIIYTFAVTLAAVIVVLFFFYLVYPQDTTIIFHKKAPYPRSVIYETVRNFVFVPKDYPEFHLNVDSISTYSYVNTEEKQKAMYYRMFLHKDTPKDVYITAMKKGKVISRVLRDKHYSIKSEIRLKSVSDTVTNVTVRVDVRLDFWHKYKLKNLVQLIKTKLFPQFYQDVDSIIRLKKQHFSFRPVGFIPTDTVRYRYFEAKSGITYFDDLWAPVFTSILIKLYSEGAVDPHKKSFLLIYNYGNKPFVFRAGVPVKRETLKTTSDFTANTLIMKHYYAFEYTGDYWLFPYAFVEAKKFLKSRGMVYDTSKPVMERFVVGHSTEDDPANFKTQLLFLVKNNPAE